LDICRRRRDETSIRIRKSKREGLFSSKRHITLGETMTGLPKREQTHDSEDYWHGSGHREDVSTEDMKEFTIESLRQILSDNGILNANINIEGTTTINNCKKLSDDKTNNSKLSFGKKIDISISLLLPFVVKILRERVDMSNIVDSSMGRDGADNNSNCSRSSKQVICNSIQILADLSSTEQGADIIIRCDGAISTIVSTLLVQGWGVNDYSVVRKNKELKRVSSLDAEEVNEGDEEEKYRCFAAVCLGNIASRSLYHRDFVLRCDAVQSLVKNVERVVKMLPSSKAKSRMNINSTHKKITKVSWMLLSNTFWALSNLCGGSSMPSPEHVSCALSSVASVLDILNSLGLGMFQSFEEYGKIGQRLLACKASVLEGACKTLFYLTEGSNECIRNLMTMKSTVTMTRSSIDIVLILKRLLTMSCPQVIVLSLGTLRNIVASANPCWIRLIIDVDVLKQIPLLLIHSHPTVRCEVCCLLSDMVSSFDISQIGSLIKYPSIPATVIRIIRDDPSHEVRRVASRVLRMMSSRGSDGHVQALVELGVIDAVCGVGVLRSTDVEITLAALDIISDVLKVGRNASSSGSRDFDLERNYASRVDECDGLDIIEELQYHKNDVVYRKSMRIIEMYFGIEEEIEKEVSRGLKEETKEEEKMNEEFSFAVVLPTQPVIGGKDFHQQHYHYHINLDGKTIHNTSEPYQYRKK